MTTTKKQTPANVKADENLAEGQTTTKLAQVENPAKVTKADIDEIAGKDRDPNKPEESANADVAKTLEDNKAAAKSKDDEDRGYFGGQGGAAGI